MKDLLTFIGEFYVFGINAPWLLATPLVIAIVMLLLHPFTGEDGLPRFTAFFYTAIVPVFLYMIVIGDLVEKYETLSIIPLVWIAIMWLVALSFKYNIFGTETKEN